jgi:2-keto-3-deoxy-L-rhamnonate aldolase RhmA
MRKSKTLARIRAGEVIRTCNLGHFIPGYVAQAARAGYDCIWLDLEHRYIDGREVQALMAYARIYDIDMMVRPPTREYTGLNRFLEEGAAGLLIPMVESAAEAKKLVDATKFPPLGNRGLDNAGFDSDFHLEDNDTYVEWASRETFLGVQIESLAGLAEVDAIAATPGVDLLFVGPGDFGLRLKQQDELTIDDVWEQVAAACKRHGKAFGGPTFTPEEIEKRHKLGAQMLPVSSEFASWATALHTNIHKLDGY